MTKEEKKAKIVKIYEEYLIKLNMRAETNGIRITWQILSEKCPSCKRRYAATLKGLCEECSRYF